MEQKIEQFIRWKKGRDFHPIGLYLHVTDRCNLRCGFCEYGREKKVTSELGISEWNRIINEAAQLGVRWVDMLGGEPFILGAGIMGIMANVKAHQMEGSIVTNGTLVNELQVKEIVAIGWDLVQVSIDSPYQDVQDRLRGAKGSYSMAVGVLEWFEYWKRKSDSEKPAVQINSVLTRLNIMHLRGIIELAEKHGCGGVKFIPMVESTEGARDLNLGKSEIEKLNAEKKRIIDYSEKVGVEINLVDLMSAYSNRKARSWYELTESKIKSGKSPVCLYPWWCLRIDSRGWANCCISFRARKLNIKAMSLRDVWHSDEFERIRKHMMKSFLPACRYCCFVVGAAN